VEAFKMTRLIKFVGGVAVALVMVMSAPMAARAADDKDVIDYRQNIMKALDAQTAAIGMIVSTQIPEDNLVSHAEAIAMLAKQVKKSFEPKVQGGEAKPEVWTEWADFSKKIDEFVAGTEQMAKNAKTGGIPVVTEQMVAALTCKGCHDTYRAKK
jgi:cytochrome c556